MNVYIVSTARSTLFIISAIPIRWLEFNCIAVFVRSDGRVTGVNAYRYDYYRDTAIAAESVQTAVSASNATVQDGEITLRYIAVNDGELCLVTNYTGEDGLRQDVRRIE